MSQKRTYQLRLSQVHVFTVVWHGVYYRQKRSYQNEIGHYFPSKTVT